MMKSEPVDIQGILDDSHWEECDDLELKSARGGLPKSLWETYSAMANSYGGVILLGVEDDGKFTGITDVSKVKTDLWNTLNNRGKVSYNLLSDNDVSTVEYAGVTLLAIRIPRADRYQHPIFIGQNPLRGTYRRNYEGDYHCTEQEVSRMLSDHAEYPADSRILEHYTLDDLDLASLQQYRNRFASLKPTHPWLSEDELGFLSKLGAFRKDRKTGVEGITVAGMIMFGNDAALREALPQYHVDYREKLSDDSSVRWTDRLIPDGTWAGNLFQFYLHVIQRLSADLKIPFQLDSDLFRKGETIVHEAIREVLVNALIHADYQGMGGIVIEKYQDRFELSNPGTLLVSIDQLFNGNISECRNKTLQTIFMMLGTGEKAGSGIDKIRLGWESQHWRLPRVTEQMQPDRVMWMLPMLSLIPEESLQRLKLQFGTDFEYFSNLEVQALVTADIEKRVDNRRLQQISGEHTTDITNLLRSLVSNNKLVKKGLGRWSWYHLPEITEQPGTTADSLGNETHSLGNETHSLGNETHSLGNENQSLDYETELLHIASPARLKKRLPAEEMKKIILLLCSARWLSRVQISELVNRNPEDLRKRFINPMVLKKLLRIRYPETPNRTDQAYQTINVSDLY